MPVLVILFVVFSFISAYSQTFYVAPNSPKILSQNINKPGDFIYTLKNASEGSIIYIRAGKYDTTSINISTNNISLIGYTLAPNDINIDKIHSCISEYSSELYDTIFPTFNFGDRSLNKIGFFIRANNVSIKNLRVCNTKVGFKIIGNQNNIENIIAYNFGDINNSYSGTALSLTGNLNKLKNIYILNAAAEGITIFGDSNEILSCKVFCTDTVAYSETDYFINISPNYQTFHSIGNVVDSCYIEKSTKKIPHKGHLGHGYCLNTRYFHKLCDDGNGFCYDSTLKNLVLKDNIIKNSVSKNIFGAFFLRGDGTKSNKIINCKSLSIGYIELNASCSYNVFENCYIKDTYYYKDKNNEDLWRMPGVFFASSYFGQVNAYHCPDIEGNSYPWESQYGPHHNSFINCIFENVASAICNSEYSDFEYPKYHSLAGKPTDRENHKIIYENQFIHCNFVNTISFSQNIQYNSCFFLSMRGNKNNKIVNSIIFGFETFESRSFPDNTSYDVVQKHGLISSNFEFNNCLFFNNSFDNYIKFNNASFSKVSISEPFNNIPQTLLNNCFTGINPEFVDLNNSNFHLLNSSFCIDNGIYFGIASDFENNSRFLDNKVDIGAFEFQGDKNFNNKLLIFPNPAINLIIINNYNNQDEVLIYNSIGNLVYKGFDKYIDVSDLKKGMYLIVAGDKTAKFIKN